MNTSTTEVLEYQFFAGVDCGNYETELASFNENGDIVYENAPSVIQFSTTKHPELELTEKQFIDNLFDHLHIHFKSANEQITSHGFYNVGKAAINAQGIKQNMKINSNLKSSNDIPVIMSATVIAATVLKEHYLKTKKLPKQLNVVSEISTAIPSSEYNPTRAKLMEERLKGLHSVEFYLGKNIVTVNVDNRFVKCTEEGKTSMLAFTSFDNDVLKEYNKQYNKNASVQDFINKETFHTDIGDGTSEFTYIKGLNPIGSNGERLGVGHATSNAMQDYSNSLGGYASNINRQEFMEILRGDYGRTAKANECFAKAVQGQANELFASTTDHYIDLTKASAEYIFVHGGGSCVFKDELYKRLVEFAETVDAEVVYIPCNYATHMNSTGNLILIKKLLKK